MRCDTTRCAPSSPSSCRDGGLLVVSSSCDSESSLEPFDDYTPNEAVHDGGWLETKALLDASMDVEEDASHLDATIVDDDDNDDDETEAECVYHLPCYMNALFCLECTSIHSPPSPPPTLLPQFYIQPPTTNFATAPPSRLQLVSPPFPPPPPPTSSSSSHPPPMPLVYAPMPFNPMMLAPPSLPSPPIPVATTSRIGPLIRTKFIYKRRFGGAGFSPGLFKEPSGLAVSRTRLAIADTNNHRIQVFDHHGNYLFSFGTYGKQFGQLVYPNRVAICPLTNQFVICERAPVHQIQIYTSEGMFVRRFGRDRLLSPRALTVDSRGRIVIVECKIMRVLVLDASNGATLYAFCCNDQLRFPNNVYASADRNLLYIADNAEHCVKIFTYEGVCVQQIGGPHLTCYPIAVDEDQFGRLIVVDNHNHFNCSIFNQDGTLVAAYESRTKHAQCMDAAILPDGCSIVMCSRDQQIYIYTWMDVAYCAPVFLEPPPPPPSSGLLLVPRRV